MIGVTRPNSPRKTRSSGVKFGSINSSVYMPLRKKPESNARIEPLIKNGKLRFMDLSTIKLSTYFPKKVTYQKTVGIFSPIIDTSQFCVVSYTITH